MRNQKFFAGVVWSLGFSLMLTQVACDAKQDDTENSEVSVTRVNHTEVKQQSIGNCWLYAVASWMESLKLNEGQSFNVSESYWTYWDWYEKLRSGRSELTTGGHWSKAKRILNKYGWVEEGDFIPEESDAAMSDRQACAERKVRQELKSGGRLDGDRSEATLLAVLDEAFTCNSQTPVNGKQTWQEKSRTTLDTMLRLPNSDDALSMKSMMNLWKTVYNPNSYDQSSLKRLPSESTMRSFKKVETRIKKALNDHMPVILSFFVSFNAVDENGKFNLNSLAEKGSLGSTGGHMVVMHDYTVDNVPGFDYLGEGDMDAELKEAALLGDFDYIVNKNSWGSHRTDRPWLKDGYSRITWDYLTKIVPTEDGDYQRMLYDVVLPPGY